MYITKKKYIYIYMFVHVCILLRLTTVQIWNHAKHVFSQGAAQMTWTRLAGPVM